MSKLIRKIRVRYSPDKAYTEKHRSYKIPIRTENGIIHTKTRIKSKEDEWITL